MLSLQRWWLVTAPTDLRCGIDRLLLAAQTAMHRPPAEGEAYVFANRAATRIKAAVLRPPGGSLPDCARAWTCSGCLSRRWQVPRRCNSGMLTAWIDALPLPSTTRRRCVRRCWRCSPSAMRHWLRMVR
ncbi:IS66 family insertion sequence element accessory protein TnpB [Xanthomonas euvesicatoria]|uniref:IS66 family insertion sequence element accessory protein TnpB n=1 Tax=Xanthomonas euvesicatoria TaxID=456327 RepID=UPI001C465500|nr:IS66 family insertion sequence element accessory protein TnpB [Xanthomonas euvesicatoria]MBV6808225.1 IS66 family insertion sequence element accessory protein TnpB [Xanthomonas campestris pv. convolvuli]